MAFTAPGGYLMVRSTRRVRLEPPSPLAGVSRQLCEPAAGRGSAGLPTNASLQQADFLYAAGEQRWQRGPQGVAPPVLSPARADEVIE